MTIHQLNQMSRADFVQALGWVFEGSPWVAERAWAQRPFTDLHGALTQQVRDATREEQLQLLRAHPDLGARARMSDASVGEQAGAGLHQLTPEEFERLQAANAAYRQKFDFPFLFAVKGSTKEDVLQAIERRVHASWDEEFETALSQVYRIVSFRLQDLGV